MSRTDAEILEQINFDGTPSQSQMNVWRHIEVQQNNFLNNETVFGALVKAVAGSGKTTTIINAAKLLNPSLKSVFLAFNVDIKKEMESRLPRNVPAMTVNSIGYRTLLPYLKTLGINTDRRNFISRFRTHSVIRRMFRKDEYSLYMREIVGLVNSCKKLGVVPAGCTDGVGVDGRVADTETLKYLCTRFGIRINAEDRATVFNLVHHVLTHSFSDAGLIEDGIIDFDDQIWITVCKRPNGHSLIQPSWDVIFVDECQDLSGRDIEMLKMLLIENGLLIGVGDSDQAIYGFRGADAQAMKKLSDTFNATELPLNITYRCAKNIVTHAQELVPQIEAADNAPDGEVYRLEAFDETIFQPGDMVLCRNNQPLVDLAWYLIGRGVPVVLKGRDFGDELVSLINDLVGTESWIDNPRIPGKRMKVTSVEGVPVTKLGKKLKEWKETQMQVVRLENPDDMEGLQRIEDRSRSIFSFISKGSDGMVEQVIEDINAIFGPEREMDKVTLSSMHRSKGLEADRVFMYGDKLYPHWIREHTEEHEQEKHLDYVARTRAKVQLTYLAEAGWANSGG